MKRRSELPRALPALLLVFFLLPSLAAVAAEERLGPHLFLVRDKPGTPTHFQMIVGAGCVDEAGANCRGLAHYLEHLVLVGRNPEHKEIALRFFPDGSSNGWTSQRATVYVHSIPGREEGARADLERLFAFYAARLKDFSISDADAERERNVVRQEREWRVGSKPIVRLARKLDRLLLPDHPSGQSVIGTSEDIDAFKLDDARAFHRAWYAINNVDFVVMADIDPAVLKDIAERALAGLEPRPLPPRTFAKPPAIVEGRTDIVEQDASDPAAGGVLQEADPGRGGRRLRNRCGAHAGNEFSDQSSARQPLRRPRRQGRACGRRALDLARSYRVEDLILSIGAEAAQDVAPETVLAAITDYVGNSSPRACPRRRWRGSRRGSPKAAPPPTRTRGRSTAAWSVGWQAAAAMSSSRAGRSAWLPCRPSKGDCAQGARRAGPHRHRHARSHGRASVNRPLAALALATALLAQGAASQAQTVTRPTTPAGLVFRHIHMPEDHFQALFFAWKDGTATALPGMEALASLGTALIMEGPRGLDRSAMIEELRDLQATATLGATVSASRAISPRRRRNLPPRLACLRARSPIRPCRRIGSPTWPGTGRPSAGKRMAVPKRWRSGCSRAS